MKKTFFAAFFSLSISFLSANNFSATPVSTKITADVNASKSIDVTFRSANGCNVRFVGTLVFSITPASIGSFTGSVTITGGTNSPNGTLAFSRESKVLNMNFDNQDVKRLRTVKWTGNALSAAYVTILNEAAINNSLVALFNTFG